MDDIETNIKPLIPESSTSESTTVEVIMNDLRDKFVQIPDYQRDSDQWSEPTQSLLVESVINNLSIPAFFFEVIVEGGVEHNQVIDGQQRLTTLFDFFRNKFRLVDSQDAPYLSPNSVHYAGRTFDELPQAYQQAFKKYRLAVIKLRNLGGMRLEVFRRINQGGTPLSGQDIRLAYYGEKSPSLAFMRLIGIYDPDRQASRRFLENARRHFHLSYPWRNDEAREAWRDWWEDKEISRGQTASETFLWSLMAAQVTQLDSLLENDAALRKLNVRFTRAIDEALDAYCAQLNFQDLDSSMPPVLMAFDQMRDSFFPSFERWILLLLGQKGPSLPVTKHRTVAVLIGAAYRAGVDPTIFTEQQWTNVVEFVRRPSDIAKKLGIEWPLSKGRWDGQRGYRAQLEAAHAIVAKLNQ
jgi:hypothetical protein